jgi:hypothetical protein
VSTAADKILVLRQLLAERFGAPQLASEDVFPTGFAALDEIGVPRRALTEVVAASASTSPGGTLLLYGLLHAMAQRGERLILVDGRDTFAPKGLPQAELNRLLWVRCRTAAEVIKSADLIIRDGNIPLVVLLLMLNPAAELRRIPPNAWHRLQMLAEKSGAAVLAFTPHDLVGCARLRISVRGSFPLERLHVRRSELLRGLVLQVERRRIGKERDEELRRAACA